MKTLQIILISIIVTFTLSGCALSKHTIGDWVETLKTNTSLIAYATTQPFIQKLSAQNLILLDKVKAGDVKNQKTIDLLHENQKLKGLLAWLTFGSIIVTSVGLAAAFFISWKVGIPFTMIGIVNIILALVISTYAWVIALVGLAAFMAFGGYAAYIFLKSHKANKEVVSDVEAVKVVVPEVAGVLKDVSKQSTSTRKIVDEIKGNL